ncbi:MAG: hypothetical protein WCR02_04635 [Sphaerochaetaceae bacterium]|jgi:hypothetical protein
MIRLSTRKTKQGIKYKVNLGFTVFCGAILAFLLWGLALNLSEGMPLSSLKIPLAMALASVFGVLYRETWSFFPEERKVVSVFGFGPFVKKESFSYEDIQRLELTHFIKGSYDDKAKPNRKRRKAVVVFSLRLSEEETRTIEVVPEYTSAGRTESAAQALCAVSGLSLYVDRPRDMDMNVSLREM